MIEYLRLKSLIYYRLFRDFPILIRLLFIAIFFGLIYGLYSVETGMDIKVAIIIIGLQVLLSITIQTIDSKEVILLKSLNVSIRQIRLVRVLLLAILFFLLNPMLAIPGMVLGIISAVVPSVKGTTSIKSFVLPTVYKRTSYRWIASCRRGGIWIILVSLFLQIMGYIHGNVNMVIVSTCSIMCLPCLYSYAMGESKAFLQYYKSPALLMKKKILENLINTGLLAIIALPVAFLSSFGEDISIIMIYVGCIYLNLFADGIYYADYPAGLIAIIIFFIVLVILVALFFQFPLSIFIVLALFILLVTYYFAYSHIKAVIYEHN